MTNALSSLSHVYFPNRSAAWIAAVRDGTPPGSLGFVRQPRIEPYRSRRAHHSASVPNCIYILEGMDVPAQRGGWSGCVVTRIRAEGTVIHQDLTRRFDKKRIAVTSFIIALLVAATSAIAIHHDLNLNGKSASVLEIIWCCCGYFLLDIMGARTTDVARFYGTFAAHLKIDSDRVFALDPAHSWQVAQIALIGQSVLLFWFGIACSVLTLVPLFRHLSWFVLTVVPIASFFSLGFGTIVFLKNDHDLRSAVNAVATSTLRSVQDEIADLFNRRSNLDQIQWKHLEELTSLHKQIVKTGSYRSIFLAGLSILVPLVGPAISHWDTLAKVLAPIRKAIFKG